MYARGILFGKMKYELGDHSFVRCPELGLVADVEFKTKGYFGGTYNAIGGIIKNEKTGEALYELSGMWSGEMVSKDLRVRLAAPHGHNLLTLRTEWQKRSALQRLEIKSHSANSSTDRRAGGARVPEIMAENGYCHKGVKSYRSYRREKRNRR